MNHTSRPRDLFDLKVQAGVPFPDLPAPNYLTWLVLSIDLLHTNISFKSTIRLLFETAMESSYSYTQSPLSRSHNPVEVVSVDVDPGSAAKSTRPTRSTRSTRTTRSSASVKKQKLNQDENEEPENVITEAKKKPLGKKAQSCLSAISTALDSVERGWS